MLRSMSMIYQWSSHHIDIHLIGQIFIHLITPHLTVPLLLTPPLRTNLYSSHHSTWNCTFTAIVLLKLTSHDLLPLSMTSPNLDLQEAVGDISRWPYHCRIHGGHPHHEHLDLLGCAAVGHPPTHPGLWLLPRYLHCHYVGWVTGPGFFSQTASEIPIPSYSNIKNIYHLFPFLYPTDPSNHRYSTHYMNIKEYFSSTPLL